MTDTERDRVKAICEAAGVKEIDDLSDGFHTFRQLYYQRMMLFATIVKQNKDRAWKSLRHEDGELCFGGGWFIVGIDTPEGSYTYHYEDSYFSLFDCEELEYGKHWDGHTEKDVTRLLSLPSAETHEERTETHGVCLDTISRQAAINSLHMHLMYRMGTDSNKKRLDDWINNLPSAQTEQRWIPCSETVDIPDHEIMACDKYGEMMFGYLVYEDDQWLCESDGSVMYDPKAWMPLPEPYRGEGEK